MNEMVTIATFNERKSAETLEKRLRDASVAVHVDDESAIQRARLFAPKPKAHMRVEVAKPDVDRAKKLLAEWEPSGVMRNAVRCPECNSSRIQYPQFTRNFLLPNLMAAIFWKLGVVPADFFCEDCQYTWPAEDPKDVTELDTLYWPKDGTKHGPLGPK